MITLKVKNKIQLSLDALIADARKKDGVPDYFTMEPSDFAAFLIELRKHENDTDKFVKISTKDNQELFKLNQQIKTGFPYTEDELYELVDKWSKGKYDIKYQNILIKREQPKKTIKKKTQDQ